MLRIALNYTWVQVCFILLAGNFYNADAQSVSLTKFNTGDLTMPVEIASAGDDRLFIIDQNGKIEILNADGSVNSTPFLDITDRIPFDHSQHGLLGLAFSPDYDESGAFYVCYIGEVGGNESTIVSRFTVSESDPDVANAGSEEIIFSFIQPDPGLDHKAGCIKFGPDGYLYVATGDGGKATNGKNSQDLSKNLGKILRLDVVDEDTYAVPDDNPFVGETGNDEIWAYGLRNPWKISFDRDNGDFWIGDVGGDVWDEINFQTATSGGGENYGWPCYEADADHILDGCDDKNTMTFPVADFYQADPSIKVSITGGFVYRGSEQSSYFQGHYIYVEAYTGEFFELYHCDGEWIKNSLGTVDEFIVSFGEDANGELYASTLFNPGYDDEGNNVYKVNLTPPQDYEEGEAVCNNDPVDIEPVSQQVKIKVYPVPADDHIIINTTSSESVSYKIVHVNGSMIQKGILNSSKTQVDITDIPSGVYILHVFDTEQNRIHTSKFMK